MSKKKVLLRGVFINRDTNGEGVLKVGTTLIRVSTVMGILYIDGDYANLKRCDIESDDLKLVARALLPPEIMEGSRLKYELMQYEII